jgi:hypothetical protein
MTTGGVSARQAGAARDVPAVKSTSTDKMLMSKVRPRCADSATVDGASQKLSDRFSSLLEILLGEVNLVKFPKVWVRCSW